jgi:hypothetical protein
MIGHVAAATAAALGVALLHALAEAPEPDAAGCTDIAPLNRVSDCWIDSCRNAESNDVSLQVGAIDASGEAKFHTVRGRTQAITYACPVYVTETEVMRVADQSLFSARFTPVFSGETPLFDHSIATWRAGNDWIQVEAAEYCAGTMYFQTVVRETDAAH